MPLYEYRCRSCGHQFEIQQSIIDDALTACPECEGALKKVFAPVGIAFKGSGFYKKDARPSSGSSSGSGRSGDSSSGGSDSSESSGGSDSSGNSTGSAGAKETATTSASPSGNSD